MAAATKPESFTLTVGEADILSEAVFDYVEIKKKWATENHVDRIFAPTQRLLERIGHRAARVAAVPVDAAD